MLSRAGAPVAMIGRQTFADAVKRNGLFPRYTEFRAHLEFTVAAAHGSLRVGLTRSVQ